MASEMQFSSTDLGLSEFGHGKDLQMKLFSAVTLCLLLLLCVASPSLASTITYTETATASGAFGGANYSNALVTISFIGDTANVSPLGVCCQMNDIGTATVSVMGLGTGTFTDMTGVLVNNSGGSAGVSDFSADLAVLFASSPAFSSYDLQSDIGPISGAAVFNAGRDFATTAGDFSITGVSGNVTFDATVGAAAVPEPGSLLLLGSTLFGFAGVFRSRLRR
jgi:hypothetical protein